MNRVFIICAALLISSAAAEDEIDLTPLKTWVENQKGLKSLRAEFTQERKLRTLKKPLTSEGKFWFQAPDQFRWEIGDPPKSIAIHSGSELTVLDTAKMEAEVIDTSNDEDDSRSRFAAFFDLSVPQTWEAFEAALHVVSVERDGETWVAQLTPKDPKRIRGVKSIAFRLDAKARQLLAFSLLFRDGSTLQSVFTKLERNASVDGGRFAPSLEGYDVKRQ